MWRNIHHLTSPLKMTFELSCDRIGHWCARRADGKVCGTFFERDAAVRFARRECRDESLLLLIIKSASEIVRAEGNFLLPKSS